jgi:hypothetical protein
MWRTTLSDKLKRLKIQCREVSAHRSHFRTSSQRFSLLMLPELQRANVDNHCNLHRRFAKSKPGNPQTITGATD